ncbi:MULTISPECIES: D-alanyl-D-alanine carboxypeptidase family protein [Mesorhizobium]|uniref:D-alanyl-D-alanine carboxypeptidase family protein n=1 Tax=Mesorhizobium TaxID=68287 RepID=UPI001FE11C9C|nr:MULTISPECIES: D-alanyl-D-alanine carboxypeptidase family protein [Mesorhizobium]
MHLLPRIAATFQVVIGLLLLTVGAANAQLFETKAQQAFMIDADSGTILIAKNADTSVPPASLAKLMTMEVVFDAIASGKASMNDTFKVSEYAWRTGGAPSRTSTMFAALNSEVRLEDLIQGVIVQSANDGCIIIAEGMAGSETAFSERMNSRAQALGMTRSRFVNSTGLPASGQVVTMRELVTLANHLWRDYPQFYKYYSQPEFTWNKITQRNRNPLLAMGIGADGLGTGFTEESGYAFVGSAARNDRRLFVALGGLTSDKERAEEARRIVEWGMTAFERAPLFAADTVVGRAKVFGGDKPSVELKAKGAVSIFLPQENRGKVVAHVVYNGPLTAPIVKGTPVGSLKVWVDQQLTQETPLFAAEDIGKGTLSQRARSAAEELAFGWLRDFL